jgi:hypothetical protein
MFTDRFSLAKVVLVQMRQFFGKPAHVKSEQGDPPDLKREKFGWNGHENEKTRNCCSGEGSLRG